MNRLDIKIQQSWGTLDEAISYFLDLVLDLQAAKRFPDAPAELYLECRIPGVPDEKLEKLTIRLTNL